MGVVLLNFLPKAKQYYLKKKKLREKRANMERARLVKTIREEVRRYLEELQK